jgi:hypothetical protein
MSNVEFEERIRKLETQNRRFKRGVLFSFIAVTVAGLMGATTYTCCDYRGRSFILVDESGEQRAILKLHHGEPVLEMTGTNGRGSVRLGIIPEWRNAASLSLRTGDAGVAAVASKGAAIQMNQFKPATSEDGPDPATEIFVDPDADSDSSSWRRTMQFQIGSRRKPYLALRDENGERARINTDSNDKMIQLRNTDGNVTFEKP